MIVTVKEVKTTPCTMAAGQFVTELVCEDGSIFDPFLFAIDVADPFEISGEELCRQEEKAAEKMIGRTYRLEGVSRSSGCYTPHAIAEIEEPDQGRLF